MTRHDLRAVLVVMVASTMLAACGPEGGTDSPVHPAPAEESPPVNNSPGTSPPVNPPSQPAPVSAPEPTPEPAPAPAPEPQPAPVPVPVPVPVPQPTPDPMPQPAPQPDPAPVPPPPAPTPQPEPPPAPPPAPNTAPRINGSAGTSATIGANYRFAPTATDAEGDALVWSIRNKPNGATFSVTTGVLAWTPSTAGTWGNIVITVTDSKGAAASLPAFSIRVTAPEPVGTAALSWSPPTQYTDGSALPGAQLGGYRIYHGRSSSSLQRLAEVDGHTTTMEVTKLETGTHYFAVTAVTITGAESGLSAVGSKTVL